MPCSFELKMEFICYFIFTFIIYFCVFYFIPYEDVVDKIFGYLKNIYDKFLNFIKKLIPDSFKKKVSSIFPTFIVTFFTKTIPKLLKAKIKETNKSLKEKLEKIKKETERKLKKHKKGQKDKKNFITKTQNYLYEQYVKITQNIKILWQKFKDKILPCIIISLIYFVIWLIFFRVIPTILKYLLAVATNFKNAAIEMKTKIQTKIQSRMDKMHRS